MDNKQLTFYQKYGKRIFDLFFAIIGLVLLWPIFLLIGILIKLDSPGSIVFKQKRVGKDGKIFTMYKFRTMVKDAERLKEKYRHLNEADGPVFKIRNDPRFTKIGKLLSHTGLDESPQLYNILRGEMDFVGPRPLPPQEDAKIPQDQQRIRRKAKPGLVSSWLANGAHNLTFKQWLEFDLKDIENKSLSYDIKIIFVSLCLLVQLILRGSDN